MRVSIYESYYNSATRLNRNFFSSILNPLSKSIMEKYPV